MRIVKSSLTLALASALAMHIGSLATANDQNASKTVATQPNVAQVPSNAVSDLPTNVITMRESLLAAARSGQIDEIRTPLEWNELPPTLSDDDETVADPIAHLKSLSADGEGAEVLANLLELLSLPPAKLHLGRDLENSAVFVWPYLSELPLKNLTPRQKVELFAIMPPKVAKTILETGRWSWWRLTIGADGTWHSFMKHQH